MQTLLKMKGRGFLGMFFDGMKEKKNNQSDLVCFLPTSGSVQGRAEWGSVCVFAAVVKKQA